MHKTCSGKAYRAPMCRADEAGEDDPHGNAADTVLGDRLVAWTGVVGFLIAVALVIAERLGAA